MDPRNRLSRGSKRINRIRVGDIQLAVKWDRELTAAIGSLKIKRVLRQPGNDSVKLDLFRNRAGAIEVGKPDKDSLAKDCVVVHFLSFLRTSAWSAQRVSCPVD